MKTKPKQNETGNPSTRLSVLLREVLGSHSEFEPGCLTPKAYMSYSLHHHHPLPMTSERR